MRRQDANDRYTVSGSLSELIEILHNLPERLEWAGNSVADSASSVSARKPLGYITVAEAMRRRPQLTRSTVRMGHDSYD